MKIKAGETLRHDLGQANRPRRGLIREREKDEVKGKEEAELGRPE